MRILWIILICYFTVINVIGFAMMGIDKSRARRGAWRLSERSLFLAAVLGGGIGCIAGMHFFRHKTKHWYFKFGMPAILIVQVVVLVLLIQADLW